MMQRWGIDAAVFSLKCYAAAMLATFVAFSIGLERPYWAFLTAYIVSGPLAGAVVSGAIFRLIGSVAGAAFVVFAIPPVIQSPVVMTAVMAGWLGLCVFLSLLDRTPTSYMFVLAGYTAGLIVWPIVDAPAHIFDVAALRVQEIAIGIICSALVHGVVLPNSVTRFLRSRTQGIVRDAEIWSHETLGLEPRPGVDAERRRLAQDVTELHQLSVHLPFDTGGPAPRISVVRALEHELAKLMPLGAAIADRIAALRAHDRLPESTVQLLHEAREWVDRLDDDLVRIEETGAALTAKCAALEPEIDADSGWSALLHMSLLARLNSLIEAHVDCRVLKAQLATQDRRPVSPRIPGLLTAIGERPLHRDTSGALRGAAGAALTVIIGCTLWYFSGWPEGGTFVMLASVFPALFAAMDNSLPPVVGFFKGSVIAMLLGTLYGFVILPELDGFPEMALSLAPVLLILGALLSVPRYIGIALPALLGVGGPFIISEKYGTDLGPGIPANFATFLNSQIATLAAILFAGIMIRILQTAGIEHAIARTLRAGWQDLAERSNRWDPPNVQAWISRMLDRHALLGPRLAATGKLAGEPLYDILRDLRIGVAIGELRVLRNGIDPARQEAVTRVLAAVGEYYRRLVPHKPPPPDPELLAGIDAALRRFNGDARAIFRRQAILPLVTLRRTLFADAAPFTGSPASPGDPS
ncbi:FUSC family protein [Novosphingobium album (ex Hu et al. 2023)]|uniref:FUSC family protein n=1 Tax=Novosphingobium album (ex Hu et al. 2023) TaxID=2930093 RepID=A0ABT0B2W3_9SPHN|nr:FUSC family protein [Novosphingobium album (ex Hu et al. 2023)]MCJ2179397.1 FUSC family protein [Novosphingobium album (ex Hu et al. 2023)]